MASSACDPLRIPAWFWQRDDVGNALDHRDIGALFRLLTRNTGASQTRIDRDRHASGHRLPYLE